MIKGTPIEKIKINAGLLGKRSINIELEALRLRPGQVLSGKVIQAKPDGWLLISSGEKRFKAHTSLPLREGAKYRFQVRSIGSQIRLKVLGSPEHSGDSALEVWESGKESRSAFSKILRGLAGGRLDPLSGKAPNQTLLKINKLLPLILYQVPSQDDAFMLPQRLIASGMFWENKVLRNILKGGPDKTMEILRSSDLKGLLLKLKGELLSEDKPSYDPRTAREQVDRLLSILQGQQELTLNAMKEGWSWYWFIPGGDEKGFLHGEALGKKSPNGESHNIRMNLTFTRLGEIWVAGLLKENDVSVDIRATSGWIVSFLEKNLSLLEKGLRQRGLNVGRLSCELMPETHTFNPFDQEVVSSPVVDMVI